MKKGILFFFALCLAMTGWAQSSPYTGVAASDIVSGNDYYLYNVETGLWLQNNDRVTSDWHTHGELGTRGLDFQLNAYGGGYKINAKFGRGSINRDNFYLDANDDHVWTFESVTVGSVSNAVNIKSESTTMGAINEARTYKAQNLFTEETESNYYLANRASSSDPKNDTWQIVTKEERLAKMATATEVSPMDASWLIKSPDFPNNDSRYNSWTKTGAWGRGGDANGDWGRGSMIMESWNSGNNVELSQTITVPNGKYTLQLQGYYRDGMAGDNTDFNDRGCTNETCIEAKHNDGTEVIRAKYYANNTEADLRSIIDETHTSAKTGPDCWNFTRLGNYYFPNNMETAQRAMNIEKAYVNDPIEVTVTDGLLTIGVKKTGSVAYDWVILDNFKLTYLGPVVDLGPYLETLNNYISEAEAYNGMTTDVLASNLESALASAIAARSSEDTDVLSQAAQDLHNALDAAKAVDVSALRPTVALAKAEGIDVAAQEDYLANGTTNEIENRLRLVRNLRKLNAIEKVDITRIVCSEPANEEADYYLYNVGAGIFFNTTADWGTHIAIDNPGMLIHFRPDGEWGGASGRPVFHLSGNGWDGMNWGEEYWDKDGINKLAFVPVEGKDKVYSMCEWDNYNWHFVYDPADDVCDGNTHYWNSVQKREWNRNDYVNNPYAQWMLVSPEAYKAAMAKATEDNPLDVTFLIENPNFSKVSGGNWTRGWNGVGGQMRGEEREPWCVIEWFEANADMKQTITGLTPGKYRVSCYGFFRDGSSDNEASKVKNGEALRQLAKVVAINGDNERKEALLPNVTSEAGNMPGVGETRDGVDGEFACWPWQANEYFQTGLYKATTPVIEVGEDGNLTIGVEMSYDGAHDGTWVVVGNFRLESVGVNDFVEIGDAKYATYVAPFDVDFTGSEVSAFAAQEESTWINLEPVTTVPAGTAVVVKADAAGRYPVSSTTDATLGTENILTSASENITANGTQYILAKVGEQVGFHQAETGTTISAGKGYLVLSSPVKAFYGFEPEDETGINNVETSIENAAFIYNLAGQRLNKTQKGVNIIGSKKVLK